VLLLHGLRPVNRQLGTAGPHRPQVNLWTTNRGLFVRLDVGHGRLSLWIGPKAALWTANEGFDIPIRLGALLDAGDAKEQFESLINGREF